jgi:hypothetical protein
MPVMSRPGWPSGTDAPDLGLRRISWVRIELLAHGHRCAVVVGVSHRLPVERSVPLGTALELWRSGVPTVLRHREIGDNAVSPELAGSG